MTRSIPNRKMSRRRAAGLQPEWRSGCARSKATRCASSSRLRRQHEREVAAPPQRERGAGLFPRGDRQVHGPDAGRHGPAIHLRDGGEVDHHPALRYPADRPRLSTRSPESPGPGAVASARCRSRQTGAKAGRRRALQEPVLNRALTRFRLPWTWDGQPTTIASRAIDETGYIQPSFEDLTAARASSPSITTTPWCPGASRRTVRLPMATRNVWVLAGALLVLGIGSGATGAERLGIGRPATEAEISAGTSTSTATGGSFHPEAAASPTVARSSRPNAPPATANRGRANR